MKKILLVIIILGNTLLCSCFNYTDINLILFTTATFVDIDNEGKINVYLETFKPARSTSKESEKGERIFFYGKGKTLMEALRQLNLSSSYKINYSQNKTIIITERAAKAGLENFIDVFDRNQEYTVRSYIVLFAGNINELIKVKLKEEQFIGLYLHDLIDNIGSSSKSIKIDIREFFNQTLYGDNINSIPVLRLLKSEMVEDKLELNGIALIKKYKLIEILGEKEVQAFNYLLNSFSYGTLEVKNPLQTDKYVTIYILKSKTKTHLEYDGEKIYLKKIIELKTSIAEVQGSFVFNKETNDNLQKSAENNIKRYTYDLFDKYKSKNIDAFDIREEFYRKYPKEKVEDIMAITELEVEPHVNIVGTTNVTDFGR